MILDYEIRSDYELEEPEIKLPLDHWKSERVPEKSLLLPYWLYQSLCVDHNKLWKILQEMGIPDHLICLLRNLYAGQEATVRNGHGTKDWFQIGKGARQGCILPPSLFNLCAEYLMRNAGLDEAQAGIKIAGRNINNLRYVDDTTYGRKWRRTKEPLDKSERGEWKSWLKAQHSENEDHGIWSHHFMVNRWRNSGNSVRLYVFGLQNHCRWWLQPWNKDSYSLEEKLWPA